MTRHAPRTLVLNADYTPVAITSAIRSLALCSNNRAMAVEMSDYYLKSELLKIKSDLFKEVRGRGLFVGVELKGDLKVDGNDFAKILFKHGLLTKATHDSTIRLAPPLVITSQEVMEAVEIIKAATEELEKV